MVTFARRILRCGIAYAKETSPLLMYASFKGRYFVESFEDVENRHCNVTTAVM